MKTTIKISGLIDQIEKLPLLNMYTKTFPDGTIIINKDFESIDEAKEYLIVRALMFHQDSKKNMDAAVSEIEDFGTINFGSVHFIIEEIQ